MVIKKDVVNLANHYVAAGGWFFPPRHILRGVDEARIPKEVFSDPNLRTVGGIDPEPIVLLETEESEDAVETPPSQGQSATTPSPAGELISGPPPSSSTEGEVKASIAPVPEARRSGRRSAPKE